MSAVSSPCVGAIVGGGASAVVNGGASAVVNGAALQRDSGIHRRGDRVRSR